MTVNYWTDLRKWFIDYVWWSTCKSNFSLVSVWYTCYNRNKKGAVFLNDAA